MHDSIDRLARPAWLFAVSIAAALVSLGTPELASAQGVIGRVVDADADTALAGAAVTLVDSAGERLVTATTDSAGAFGLPVYAPGRYTLHVQHVAYRETETRSLEVERAEVVWVEIRLSRLSFDLDPLIVTARQRAPMAYLTEYYERLDRWAEYGRGLILTREELEPLEGYTVGEILTRPTLTGRFVQRAGLSTGLPCTPVFYWNGFAVPVGQIPVSTVEAIEIYRGAEIPPQYDGNGCGVVLVWNRPVRPGEDTGRAPGWQRALMAAAAGVLFALLVN
jgi:hypothetical protein